MKRGGLVSVQRLFWVGLITLSPAITGCGGCASMPEPKMRQSIEDTPAPAEKMPNKPKKKTAAVFPPVDRFAV